MRKLPPSFSYALIVAGLLISGGARAAYFPNKPIHILVGASAGGTTDTLARAIGAEMNKIVGQPFVIEYNCRMGDPETEVVIPRLENDLVGLFVAAAKQELDTMKITIDKRSAATVMSVSGGYPGSYEKGFPIAGLDTQLAADSLLFHAGTTEKDGQVVTNGGRVLCVTSFGKTVAEAVQKSREALKNIDYDGMYYRKDIGYEFA